jgi:N-acyl-D-amino-acid deacylase
MKYLHRHYTIVLYMLALLFILICSCDALKSRYDVVIISGRIIDGTGNPGYTADVGIHKGKIATIGSLSGKKARYVIDAEGLVVMPGFIDVHTHTDREIDAQPAVMNYLRQGVTTVVGGNCGGSRYPLSELFSTLEKNGIAINFASLTGHNIIREEVMGKGDRPPTEEEISRMQELVKQEMDVGAIGLSTGLAYIPGRYSDTEEVIALAKMIQPYEGVYATHMREQGTYIRKGVEESIRIGREAGVRIQISHIKLASEDVWGKKHLILESIKEAHEQGLEVYLDQYPYTATSSGFSSSLPGWAVAGGNDSLVARLKNPKKYEEIKKHLIKRRLTSIKGIDKLKTIYVSSNDNHKEYEGKNLVEILELLGRKKTVSNAADLIIEMQKTDSPRGVFFQMAEEDVKKIMKVPYNMIASDGGISTPGEGVPHPRAYGTFPRVLARYVGEWDVLPLCEAVRKMTSLPAQAMGFYDIGVLRPGMVADITIVDLNTIKDTATFSEPHQYPEGIPYVLVNGEIVVEEGEWTGALPGKVLYGGGRK